MLDSIDFRKNEMKIGAEGSAKLEAIAEHFRRCDNIVILEVHGRKGAGERDAELPKRRAEAVQADLVAYGVDPRRLRVVADKSVAERRGGGELRGVEFKVPRVLTCPLK
jgi:outer membrane protein OmpA-like peptidoglycan-associated protein